MNLPPYTLNHLQITYNSKYNVNLTYVVFIFEAEFKMVSAVNRYPRKNSEHEEDLISFKNLCALHNKKYWRIF